MENPSNYQEKISEILELIGLHKNETLVYLTLIKNPPLSALDLARLTKIHRSNIYDSLRKLMEKGFVQEVIEENRKVFKAMKPEKLKEYIKQKGQELDEILPQMIAIPANNESSSEQISISHGAFAARQAFHSLLKNNSTILAFGASQKAIETFGLGFLKELHQERIKKKIIMKHIYNQDAMDRIKNLNKMKYTEAKYLPHQFDTNMSTLVCGNVTIFFLFSKPITIIMIKNKEISETYQKYFDLLYKSAKV
jgi:HTH-type transcriptional regulator, sugar sensing transcriptional regulator